MSALEHSTDMASIADVVDHVQPAGVPVLFLDTCILLDTIRAPIRPNQLPGCVEAARELLQLVAPAPTRCTLVVGSFVRREWLAHSGFEADSIRGHLARVDGESQNLHQVCTIPGVTPPFPTTEYRLLSLADRLYELSQRLLDAALHLDPDTDCILRAHHRATNDLAPSSKGGEIKDSTMIEECLEVSRRLHKLAYSPKRLFCTSNKNDYCERGSSRLHPTLAVDFGAASLGFATNLPWAVNEIKKP
jgi:hypothetical protein